MAIKTFTGASSTSWTNTANWSPNSLPTSSDDVVINKTASSGSSTTNYSIKSLTVNDPNAGIAAPYVDVRLTVSDNVTFNGRSYFRSGSATKSLTVTGAASVVTFNDTSYFGLNSNDLCTLTINSSSASLVLNTTYASSNKYFHPGGGNMNLNGCPITLSPSTFNAGIIFNKFINPGTITFSSLTPVTFNINNGVAWYENATNWIFSGGTPTYNFTNASWNRGVVVGNCNFTDSWNNDLGSIFGNCVFVLSSVDVPYYNIPYNLGSITGNCEFYGSHNVGTVIGDCTFYYAAGTASYNDGTIHGDVVLNDDSYNYINGTIDGDCTLNDTSYNSGSITANATFSDNSYNIGNIGGNCSFIDNSQNRRGISGTITFIPDRGINNSSVLGMA